MITGVGRDRLASMSLKCPACDSARPHRCERQRLYTELQRLRYLRLLQEVQEVQQEFERAEAMIKVRGSGWVGGCLAGWLAGAIAPMRQEARSGLVGSQSRAVLLHVLVCCVCDAHTQETQNAAKLSALRAARVVGMTTSGVARMQELVAAMKPRVRGAVVCARYISQFVCEYR